MDNENLKSTLPTENDLNTCQNINNTWVAEKEVNPTTAGENKTEHDFTYELIALYKEANYMNYIASMHSEIFLN